MSRRARRMRWTVTSAALLPLLAAAFVRAGESLPDPTRPPASSQIGSPAVVKDATGKLELRAIFHADERRFAVINGRRVQTSDRIAGAEVVAIEVDRVRLHRDGEIIELRLVAPAFKHARRAGLNSPSRAAERGDSARPDDLRGAMR